MPTKAENIGKMNGKANASEPTRIPFKKMVRSV